MTLAEHIHDFVAWDIIFGVMLAAVVGVFLLALAIEFVDNIKRRFGWHHEQRHDKDTAP